MSKTLLDIRISDIVVPEGRARELDLVWVEALAQIIDAQGLTNPITLREVDSKLVLVSGHHRLAAVRHVGHETILARLSSATSNDQARLEEVMENLARNELSALDRCHHLYELKQVYERLHPQTKNGGDRKNNNLDTRTQNLRSDRDNPQIFAFAEDTANKVGLSRRTIEMAIAIWKGLSVASRQRVTGTWLADHQSSLQSLAKLTHALQEKVLTEVLDKGAASVGDALVIIEAGRLPSFDEKRLRSLNKKIAKLNDDDLDAVLTAQADRVLAWARRTGRI